MRCHAPRQPDHVHLLLACHAAKLISRIGYLATGLSSGDFKPTNQQAEVQKLLEERLRTHTGRLDELIGKDLAAFNEMLRQRKIPNIVARK